MAVAVLGSSRSVVHLVIDAPGEDAGEAVAMMLVRAVECRSRANRRVRLCETFVRLESRNSGLL
jgi:hypothetical protein